jgi:hypothetical protein
MHLLAHLSEHPHAAHTGNVPIQQQHVKGIVLERSKKLGSFVKSTPVVTGKLEPMG